LRGSQDELDDAVERANHCTEANNSQRAA